MGCGVCDCVSGVGRSEKFCFAYSCGLVRRDVLSCGVVVLFVCELIGCAFFDFFLSFLFP